jgi:hypothetical protein
MYTLGQVSHAHGICGTSRTGYRTVRLRSLFVKYRGPGASGDAG